MVLATHFLYHRTSRVFVYFSTVHEPNENSTARNGSEIPQIKFVIIVSFLSRSFYDMIYSLPTITISFLMIQILQHWSRRSSTLKLVMFLNIHIVALFSRLQKAVFNLLRTTGQQ
jgi:hypothetical protein